MMNVAQVILGNCESVFFAVSDLIQPSPLAFIFYFPFVDGITGFQKGMNRDRLQGSGNWIRSGPVFAFSSRRLPSRLP
jgi:hypothetical protein